MLYIQSDKLARLEGYVISKITVRLNSDRTAKLNEILDKLGVGALQNGDDKSEKLRLFIDKLYDSHILRNPAQVTTQQPIKKPSQRFCYQLDNWVKTSEVCERCRLATPKVFLNCPSVLKEQGLSETGKG